MQVTIKPPYDSMPVGALLRHYQDTELKIDTPYDELVEEAKKFLQINPLSKEDAGEFNLRVLYKEDAFVFPEDWSTQARLEFIFIGFENNFCSVVYQTITGRQPLYLKLEPVERSVIPSLKAFDYNWTRDALSIPTSYSMLF